MPLYEYQCAVCGRRFEVIQKFSDAPPVCARCGGAVEKLVSSPAIQFKGTGWYITDYAKKSGAGASSKQGESSSSDGNESSSTKTDTKTDKKTETKTDTSSSTSSSSSSTTKSE